MELDTRIQQNGYKNEHCKQNMREIEGIYTGEATSGWQANEVACEPNMP
jgi:hypothetical protein